MLYILVWQSHVKKTVIRRNFKKGCTYGPNDASGIVWACFGCRHPNYPSPLFRNINRLIGIFFKHERVKEKLTRVVWAHLCCSSPN